MTHSFRPTVPFGCLQPPLEALASAAPRGCRLHPSSTQTTSRSCLCGEATGNAVMHAPSATLALASGRIGHANLPQAAGAGVEVPRGRVLQELQLQSLQSVVEPEPHNPLRED